ncbi:hypothetical protein D8Y22_03850 [Salinadaptatus halalkaliphilus]|uniref:Uncharacterized protein n=1 Tax=Salinadaptatus halalkaliphilus TaxID=2419781 RepID=A0A4S3TS59_9EURY|nr:hypothetical protein D8Y22_03850 [Salinadaptatus halalkaliphilus]
MFRHLETNVTSEESKPKLAAACVSCGWVCAAAKRSDGTVVPIGRPQGCDCGSSSFISVDE